MTVTSLTTYAERKAVGDRHEDRVRRELEQRGWTVDPYGQGVLSEATKAALGRTESPMRWDPDMIAARGSAVVLIDAKGSMSEDAFTYHVSRKALSAGRRLSVSVDLPLYYVFANLGVATPFEVMQFVRMATIGEAGAYVSFSSGLVRPFDDTFGVPYDGAVTALRRVA